MDIRTVEQEIASTRFAGKLHWRERVDSTNSLALEAARQGTPEGTLFVADHQTAGRGRGGHTWHSEPHAGLYFSFVLRPEMQAQDALWISLLSGIAVHAGVAEATGIAADLRWPNDLLIGTRKFCGILTELQTRNAHVESAVVGIGINVNHAAFPADLTEIATSLRVVSGRAQSRERVLAAVLRAFDHEYSNFSPEKREPLLTRLERVSTWIRGKQVHVPEQDGYSGITCGLDARGFLLVSTQSGTRTVLSGGVRES